ncbi:MAG: hypothetical protein ACREHD_02875, partial [Pirellulales bacterium]
MSDSQTASAQVIRRCPQPAVSLMANQIYADAIALRATGDFLVQHGIARNLEAEAASKEMDNSMKWVTTYFERRRLNREARAEEDPGYLDREEKRKQTQRRIHENGLPTGNDYSDDLNWMLREILANTSPSVFLSDQPRSLISSPDNIRLSASDRHEIRVTEGALAGGKAMVFRVDTAEMLETRWRAVLKKERFKAVREAFEDARDSAIGDLGILHEVSETNQERLKRTVDDLADELAAYYRERPKPLPPQEGLERIEAQRFLRSLAMSTFRLIETNSSLAFDKSYRFQGDSVAELLQHLMSKGLEFAPAEKGGELIYK